MYLLYFRNTDGSEASLTSGLSGKKSDRVGKFFWYYMTTTSTSTSTSTSTTTSFTGIYTLSISVHSHQNGIISVNATFSSTFSVLTAIGKLKSKPINI